METPIALPDKPGQREVSFIMESAVGRSVSPFSSTEQVYVWPGQRWRVVLKMPSMTVEDGLAWQAFFGDLNGIAGTFWVHDPAFVRTDEIDFGTPEVAGAHAAGVAILTRGWNANQRVLHKGQKIEIGGRLRQVLDDVYSDLDGNASLRCWPQCRTLADGQAIEWQNPKGVFRASSVPEFTWDSKRLQAGFQFSADEAILA